MGIKIIKATDFNMLNQTSFYRRLSGTTDVLYDEIRHSFLYLTIL